MSKIMLVEDDNNLREIYEARLLAEGYEIVSAHDGEEALALAVKEKPDLIISDVMMPKISGFDMLDILRSTPETKDTKVIMMTALSQAEDKDRADKLGADRYLVKSQVTLEDVAKIAREVLEGTGTSDTFTQTNLVPDPLPMPDPTPVVAAPIASEPVAAAVVAAAPVVAAPPTQAEPTAVPISPLPDPSVPITSTLNGVENAQTVIDEQDTVNEQVKEFVEQNPGTDITPGASATPVEASETIPDPSIVPSPSLDSQQNVNGKKILQPLSDPTLKPNLHTLLEAEEKKSTMTGNVTNSSEPATSVGDDPNLIAL
jgi:CheY-like chemotaxis protein